jgi:hypothetical protein
MAGWFCNYIGTQGYTSAMPIYQKLGIFSVLFTDIIPIYLGGYKALFSVGDIFLVLAPIITIILLIRGYVYEKNNNN